jgi:subtilase family serine protease
MKRRSALLAGSIILLATAPLVMAQTQDLKHMFAQTPIRLSNLPHNPSVAVGLLPSQFKAAYGFNRIPNQGQGQTIALVDAYDNPNIESDLAFYANYFHLAPCNFQKVEVGNPQGAPSDWALEMSLDVEQACALAPQAKIILVEATTGSMSDLLTAVQTASSAPNNATAISMSWGFNEFDGENSYDNYFCNVMNGNGQPVTFFAASGDEGHGFYNWYPAASPCVISVGGTILVLESVVPPSSPLQVNYGVETAWKHTMAGVSRFETQPSFQNPACATWSTTNRCIPDVSSDAPNIPVYATYGYDGWQTVAGTSVGTPDWASFITLVNSSRANAGKGLISQAVQDLYTIYYSSSYLTDFHDITTGRNGNCGSLCDAGPGYDLVTGIGTYQANNLFSALVADPN